MAMQETQSASSLTVADVEEGMKKIQDHICSFLVKITGQQFREDRWNFEKGKGGGISRIWEGPFDDNASIQPFVLEKGGVNFSGIQGTDLPVSALASKVAASSKSTSQNNSYHATGVSLVIHPTNPNVPTIHMNVRYFESGDVWWFGGGIDVTPYVADKNRVMQFHKVLKQICERNNHSYDDYKKQCDEYFFIKHRKEMRGVGGIFFDQLSTGGKTTQSKEELWKFIQDVGMSFSTLYEPFITKEQQTIAWTPRQREYQLIRRSRYAEFNLVYDRGTQFGLQSQGRTESILMSLPAVCIWKYNWQPAPGSTEEQFANFFLVPQDWASMEQQQIAPYPQACAQRLPQVSFQSIGMFAVGLVFGLAIPTVGKLITSRK
jgi:coproporphyrinogen III oxidase